MSRRRPSGKVVPDQQGVSGKRKVTSERHSRDGKETLNDYEENAPLVFKSEPAYVRVAAGTTRSIGDYESLRVDVSITMPCMPEDIESTYAEVSDQVAEWLDKELDAYLGSGEED